MKISQIEIVIFNFVLNKGSALDIVVSCKMNARMMFLKISRLISNIAGRFRMYKEI